MELIIYRALALLIFAVATASADGITYHVRTKEEKPLPGETVIFYVVAPYFLISSQTTDAAGDVTFTDNVSAGQYRCIEILAKKGWTFSGTSLDRPFGFGGFNANPMCGNLFGGETFYWGDRVGVDPIKVIGGSHGYVNPGRGETAKLIIMPDSTVITTKIYTNRGKLLVTKSTTAIPGLQHEISWDGRNSDGQIVSSGIYLARITGSGLNLTAKIAIVRD